MIQRRILATTASFLFVVGTLASCGGGTGESTSATRAPSVAATTAPTKPQVASFLILQGDTVRSPEGLTDEEKPFLSCVQQGRFPQGSRIVWRFKALDPISGKALDDKAIKSFDLMLPDGKTQAFKYGGHPGGANAVPTDFFWTSGFSLPKDYPTGTFTYQIKATTLDGAVGTWDQFKVAAALLTVVPIGKR